MGVLWKILSNGIQGQMQEQEEDSKVPRGMEDRPKLKSIYYFMSNSVHAYVCVEKVF